MTDDIILVPEVMSFKERLDLAKLYNDRMEACRRQIMAAVGWVSALTGLYLLVMRMPDIPLLARVWTSAIVLLLMFLYYTFVIVGGYEMTRLDKQFISVANADDRIPRPLGVSRSYQYGFRTVIMLIPIVGIAVVLYSSVILIPARATHAPACSTNTQLRVPLAR